MFHHVELMEHHQEFAAGRSRLLMLAAFAEPGRPLLLPDYLKLKFRHSVMTICQGSYFHRTRLIILTIGYPGPLREIGPGPWRRPQPCPRSRLPNNVSDKRFIGVLLESSGTSSSCSRAMNSRVVTRQRS